MFETAKVGRRVSAENVNVTFLLFAVWPQAVPPFLWGLTFIKKKKKKTAPIIDNLWLFPQGVYHLYKLPNMA